MTAFALILMWALNALSQVPVSIDHVPPGHWWLIVSQKEMLDDTPHGPFTLKALVAVEVDAEPGALSKATVEALAQNAASKE